MTAPVERTAHRDGAVPSRPPAPTALRDHAVRTACRTVVVAALAVIVLSWATGGGLADLGEPAAGLTSLGRLTGLLASVLLLVQVLLMARVPVLERAFGQDRLARMHRLVGFTSFTLMLAHIGLITWGYAAGDLAADAGHAVGPDRHLPGHAAGRGRHACLVMVVVTSVRAARRRLRYESWHLLHLYAYLGVGLALPHQLWTGQEFLASTGAHGVLVGRCGSPPRARCWSGGSALPLARSARHGLRVAAVVPEGAGRRVGLHERPRPAPPAGRGRPVLHLALPDRAPAGRAPTRTPCPPRPTGAACGSPPRSLGDGSAAPARPAARHPGAGRGPVRPPHRPGPHPPRVALIGAGVGITPLRALAEGLPYAPGEAVLLHRSTEQPLFAPGVRRPRRAARAAVVRCPGTAGRPDSWLGAGVGPGDDLAALLTGCPTSPSATSTSAARALGRRRPPHHAGRRSARRPLPRRDLRVVTW